MLPRPLLLTLLLALSAAACAGAAVGSTEGEAASLDAVVGEAGRIDGLESLAVWAEGELVAEAYPVGDVATRRDVRSITKSVTSLLVGLAIDDGALTSVDQTIGGVRPDLAERFGPDRVDVSVGDLLTMSAGFRWDEDRLDEYLDWRQAADPIGHYLTREPVDDPGSRFDYSSPSSHLVGQLVVAATGTPLDRYAADRLFDPLGIVDPVWETLADGSVNGASGLDLRTRDLVAIGRLVLDRGRFDGHRVVSADWIESSTTGLVETDSNNRYGYLWWVESDPIDLVVASGYGGQTLAIAPEHDLVVVATAAWNVPADRAGQQAEAIVGHLRQQLLPALLAQPSPSP